MRVRALGSIVVSGSACLWSLTVGGQDVVPKAGQDVVPKANMLRVSNFKIMNCLTETSQSCKDIKEYTQPGKLETLTNKIQEFLAWGHKVRDCEQHNVLEKGNYQCSIYYDVEMDLPVSACKAQGWQGFDVRSSTLALALDLYDRKSLYVNDPTPFEDEKETVLARTADFSPGGTEDTRCKALADARPKGKPFKLNGLTRMVDEETFYGIWHADEFAYVDSVLQLTYANSKKKLKFKDGTRFHLFMGRIRRSQAPILRKVSIRKYEASKCDMTIPICKDLEWENAFLSKKTLKKSHDIYKFVDLINQCEAQNVSRRNRACQIDFESDMIFPMLECGENQYGFDSSDSLSRMGLSLLDKTIYVSLPDNNNKPLTETAMSALSADFDRNGMQSSRCIALNILFPFPVKANPKKVLKLKVDSADREFIGIESAKDSSSVDSFTMLVSPDFKFPNNTLFATRIYRLNKNSATSTPKPHIPRRYCYTRKNDSPMF